MKVGDLVRLSEYGIARDYNLKLTEVDPCQLGVITKTISGSYPYRVHWMKSPPRPGIYLVNSHARRELKYAT